MSLPFAALWDRALSYEQFVKESTTHCDLWTGVYRISRVPAWALRRDEAPGGRYRLIVLAEDWCGDASSTVPHVAKWANRAPTVEMRILRRDEHPEVMDRYLTGTARSIPVVIVLTEDFEEVGWWGPRPEELQAWVVEQRGLGRPKEELLPEIRRWYAKDRGESTLREILEVMATSAEPRASDAPAA